MTYSTLILCGFSCVVEFAMRIAFNEVHCVPWYMPQVVIIVVIVIVITIISIMRINITFKDQRSKTTTTILNNGMPGSKETFVQNGSSPICGPWDTNRLIIIIISMIISNSFIIRSMITMIIVIRISIKIMIRIIIKS